MNLGSNKR